MLSVVFTSKLIRSCNLSAFIICELSTYIKNKEGERSGVPCHVEVVLFYYTSSSYFIYVVYSTSFIHVLVANFE